MKKARYIRVSTTQQNETRQLKKAYPDELLFIEKVSGAIPFNERPEGKKLIEAIEAGDVNEVSVSSIDRLGRNSFNIQETLNYFKDKNIKVNVDNLGVSSIANGKYNNIFKMICDVLANVSEMERETLLERQREGIAIAKANGVYAGRVRGSVESDEEVLNKYPDAVKAIKKYPDGSLRELAKLSVSKDGKKVSMNTIKKLKAILDKKL